MENDDTPPSPRDLALRTVNLIDRLPEHVFPYVAVNGSVVNGAVRVGRTPPWTAGFWLGQLHLAEQVLDAPRIRERIDREQSFLGKLVQDRPFEFDHDIGFLMTLGHLYDHQRGIGDHSEVLHAACRSLAHRYNITGRFIRAHGYDGSAGTPIATPGKNDGPPGRFIADTWMNLPLLLWGATHFRRPEWAQVALEHVRTAQKHLVGDDGWVYHAYDVNPETGAPIGPTTIQGAGNTTPWARAQAWVIYALPIVTNQLHALGALGSDEAKQLHHYGRRLLRLFTSNSLPSGIAPWDFSKPDGDRTLPDTSASAIVLAALERIIATSNDDKNTPIEGAEELERATQKLRTALAQWVLPEAPEGGILDGGAYYVRAKIGINEASAYGDYFYMESVFQQAGIMSPYLDLVAA